MDFRCKIVRENEILAEDVRSHPNPIVEREKKNEIRQFPNKSTHPVDLRACETIANFSGHILIACSLDRQIDILRLKMGEKNKRN